MASRVYLKHLHAINGEGVTRSNVRGLQRALIAQARRERGRPLGPTAANITGEEVRTLFHAVLYRQPRVLGALHDTGLELLRSPRYANRLNRVLFTVDNLECFRLISFDWLNDHYCVPVYRAIAKNGSSFAFRNVPWQSGGNGPELLP